MNSKHLILPAVCVIPLLSSCASFQSAESSAWNVQPAFSVRHSSEKPDAYYQLGRYYQGQNRYEQALTAYHKALALDGGFVEARNGLGVIYSMQGRLQEAIEQFRLASQQAPTAAHIHNNLGYALYLSGLYAEAAGSLEQAVALEPANQAARNNLAQAQEKAGGTVQPLPILAQAPIPQPAEKTTSAPPEAQQAQVGVQPSVVAAPVALAVAQAPQQVVELPTDRDPITTTAGNPVPVMESRVQVVQLAPNVYELRERVEAQRALGASTSPRQEKALPKDHGLIMPVAQKPVPVVHGRVQTAQFAPKVYEQRERVEVQARTAPSAAGTAKPLRIEVSNGNGVTGMAKKVAGFFDERGYSGARLTNQKPFQVPSSEVHYRTGYREQAQSLVSTMPGHPTLIQANDLRWDISIRVVLGKDVMGNVAYFERGQGKIRLARSGSDS